MSIEGDLVGATSTQTASTPVGSTLRHWPLTLLLAVSGLVAGLLIGNSAPVTYRSEARLAVGPGSNSAYVIAGYPLAARDLAANYSRWVQNNARSGVWAVPGLTALSASPIPDSAVIRVEAEAEDPQLATKGAHLVAKRLVTVVGEQQRKNDPQRAFAQFQKLAPAVANAQAQLDSARTSKQKHDARVRLATAQLARDAQGDLYRRLSSDPQAVSQLVVIAPRPRSGTTGGPACCAGHWSDWGPDWCWPCWWPAPGMRWPRSGGGCGAAGWARRRR